MGYIGKKWLLVCALSAWAGGCDDIEDNVGADDTDGGGSSGSVDGSDFAFPIDMAVVADGGPDAAQPAPDAAQPDPDAAAPDPDASAPDPDAAAPDPDAAAPDPDAAAPDPDAAVETPCETYCATLAESCQGENAVYADDAACLEACLIFPGDGEPGAVEGDTIQCRQNYADQAAADPARCADAAAASAACDDAQPTDCDVFCGLLADNCQGEQAQFADLPACLTACEAFPADGEPGAIDGDSVQCRIYHAGVASEDPATHCAHAGSDSAICAAPQPTACETYCDVVGENCQGELAVYGDAAECLVACEAFPADGAPDAVDGDSIQCRAYHAGVAADEPALHCPHASPASVVCAAPEPTPCETYCGLVGDNCQAEDALYDNDAACMTACEAFPIDGLEGAVDGDSVQCRIYHAGIAAEDAGLHCPHAGAVSAVCAAPEPTPCEAYCDLVENNCQGEDAQFADPAECAASCAAFRDDGQPGDTEGDTIQCRLYHAGLAADAPGPHCGHAGPDGGGTCIDPPPTLCETYCALTSANCQGEQALFAGDAECLAACAQIPADGAFGAILGDTVQCRIYHAEIAVQDPAVHCAHAAPDGGNVCVEAQATPCDAYCDLMADNCQGPDQQFADRGECMQVCEAFPADGQIGDVDGDTLQCRIYHAGVAVAGPQLHCGHAGPTGDGVCVDAVPTPCEGYCAQMNANCQGPDQQFEDANDCLSTCLGFPTDGQPGDVDGDTIQCRQYHAGVAENQPSPHCGHAGPTGDGVCVDAPPPCDEDVFEENDSVETAVAMEAGRVVGQICPADDDWFVVPQICVGGTITVDLRFTHVDGDLDLELRHGDAPQVGNSSTDDEQLIWTNNTGALTDVFARVNGFDGAQNGYELSFDVQCPVIEICTDDLFEQNDEPAMATILTEAELANAQICPNNEDWYGIDGICPGGTLTVDMSFVHADGDLDMTLVTGGDAIVANSSSDNERLVWVNNDVGLAGVLVSVAGYQGAQNAYAIAYTVECPAPDDRFEPNDIKAAATPLDPGIYEALLSADEDWYVVDVCATGTVATLLGFTHADGDIDVQLQTADGTIVSRGESSTDDEAVEFVSLMQQQIFIRVFGFGVSNTYDMLVDVQGCDLPPACQIDADCAPGEACDAGQCVPGLGCQIDADCAPGEACDAGQCVPGLGCLDTADCPAGAPICDLGQCVGCRATADCNAGEICDPNKQCVPEPGCQIDADCAPGEACDAGQCVPGLGCQIDADCAPGDVCNAGQCVPALGCQIDADCAPGEACDAGQCVPGLGCLDSTDCPPGAPICDLGQCVGCLATADCPAGEICDPNKQCVPDLSCQIDADCNAGEQCVLGQCAPAIPDDIYEDNDDRASATVLIPGLYPDLVSADDDWYAIDVCPGGTVDALAAFLHAEGNIDLNLMAADGTLVDQGVSLTDDELVSYTSQSAQTLLVRVINDGTFSSAYELLVDVRDCSPQPGCQLDGDCAPGEICDLGICIVPPLGCQIDADCNAGEQCVLGACAPPLADDIFEENDDALSATPTISGIYPDLVSADDDWYAIDICAGGTIDALATFLHTDGNIDLNLMAADGTLVDQSVSLTDDEIVSFASQADQTLLLRVINDGTFSSAYELLVDVQGCDPQPGCQLDGDCAAGEICDLGICIIPPLGCQIDADCNAGERCLQGLCAAQDPDDVFEENDVVADATPLVPDLYQGLIAADDDWYAIDACGGGRLDILAGFIHADGDINIEVFDSTGQLITESSTVTDDELVTVQVASDETISVRIFSLGATNGYDLIIDQQGCPLACQIDADCNLGQQCVGGVCVDPAPCVIDTDCNAGEFCAQGLCVPANVDDEFEENDLAVDAAPLQPGLYSPLVSKDDDWYAIDICAGGSLDILAAFVHADGDIDMTLTAADGSVVGEGVSADDDELISFVSDIPQKMLLKVYGFGVPNTYDLLIDVAGCDPQPVCQIDADCNAGELCVQNLCAPGAIDDNFEPNDIQADAAPLQPGVHSALVSANDDWYAIDVCAGGTLDVLAAFIHADGDIDIDLFGADGVSVAQGTSITDDELVSYVSDVNQKLLLKVYSFGVTNTYELLIDVQGCQPPAANAVDFCRLQFPTDLPNATTGDLLTFYGRLFEAGMTDLSTGTDVDPLISAQLGFGADGTDPAQDPNWVWSDAVPNQLYDGAQSGEPNNDEYEATVPVPGPGTFDFAYRFTVDGGVSWTYCDGQPAGSSDGYQMANAGNLVSLDAAVAAPIFSEYVEGSGSDNKALEIYNAGGAVQNLADCQLMLFRNGAAAPSASLALDPVQLEPGATFVICKAAISPSCNQIWGSLTHNGDDGFSLVCSDLLQDTFGQLIGVDPGAGWGPNTETQNQTLRRNCDITKGDLIPDDDFDPNIEWTVFPQDTLDGLGQHCL